MPRRSFPGNLEKRGDTFRARFSIHGQRQYVTIKTSDRRRAMLVARVEYDRALVAAERRAAGLPDDVTFSAVLDQYERDVLPNAAEGTQRAYRDTFKVLRRYFVELRNDPPLAKIRPGDVQGFLTWRRTNRLSGGHVRKGAAPKAAAELPPVSARTLQKDRTVLHTLFDYAERLEFREGNPVRLVKPPRAERRQPVMLDVEQYERLLRECEHDRMLWLYVLVLGDTAVRCDSEALWLRWEDVDLDGSRLRIVSGRESHRTKTGESRVVPMSPRLAAAMREHFAAFRFGGSPWMFHHVAPRAGCEVGDRISRLGRAFTSAAKRAGLPAGLHQHDLRHRRITLWHAEGKSPAAIQRAAGHARPETTALYEHMTDDHICQLLA